jgi:hypothetical protein
MRKTPIYLNCKLPCSGFVPVEFTQNPVLGDIDQHNAATTHISFWEDKLEFPIANMPPVKQSLFGGVIHLDLPRWTEAIVCADLCKTGYRLRHFLLRHQLYDHLLIPSLDKRPRWRNKEPYNILCAVFPLRKFNCQQALTGIAS